MLEKFRKHEITVYRKKFRFIRNLIKSDILRIDLENLDDFVELEIPLQACKICSDYYLHSKNSKLENLILEIPAAVPPIIDFK